MTSSESDLNPKPSAGAPLPPAGAPLLVTADRFLDELAAVNPLEVSDQKFYQLALDRLVLINQSPLAMVWIRGPAQDFVPAVISKLDPQAQPPAPQRLRQWGRELTEFAEQPQTVQRLNWERDTVHVAKVIGAQNELRLVSLQAGAVASPAAWAVQQDLLSVVAEVMTEFERKRQVADRQQPVEALQKLVTFQRNLQGARDLAAVSLHWVNDARLLLSAERVWLFTPGSPPSLLACSGVVDVEPRSEAVTAASRLAQETLRSKQSWYWYREQSQEKNVTAGQQMDRWIEDPTLHGLQIVLVPEPVASQAKPQSAARPQAVLIAEYRQPVDPLRSTAWLTKLVESAVVPLWQARQWQQLPFRRSLLWLGGMLQRFHAKSLPGTLLALLLLAAGIASLFVIKRDFQIRVVGELRPISEQHVFAPADGQVVEVLCDYGDAVESGQNLIRLESAEYQLKQQQLQARLATAQQQLEQNQLRLMQERRTSQDRFLPEKIAADIEQLKLEIQGLERELSSYEALQRELSVTAPISGQIISRDRRQLLLGRPVTRGTILATVSDTSGPWQLVCEIQDRDSGHLFAAQQAGQVTDWKLTFKRTSALDREHQVPLQRWEDHNFIKPNGDSVVRAYAEVAELKLESLRVGQTITGQIYAGRKSLFFLWTRDLQDLLKRKFWWPGS